MVDGQQKGQGRTQPVASLTRLLSDLIRPLQDLLRAVSSSCNLSGELASGRLDVSGVSCSLRNETNAFCMTIPSCV
jgi:hypothetical protein